MIIFSGEAMERQNEVLPISSPSENSLGSVEPSRAHERHRNTRTINLLLGPLTALLVWFLVGGWLYFFFLAAR